jgi:hypothetical protein
MINVRNLPLASLGRCACVSNLVVCLKSTGFSYQKETNLGNNNFTDQRTEKFSNTNTRSNSNY